MNLKKTLLLFSCLTLIFPSCKVIDKLTQFHIHYDTSAVIPSAAKMNLPFNVMTPDIQTNSESTFEVNDTRKNLVEEIKLSSLNLSLTSPSNADFSFLKSITIYLSADSLPEIKIAWQDTIPSNVGTNLSLKTADVDLKDYIKKDKMTLRLSTVTDQILTSDYHLDIHSVFFVDAKILGQ